jgi:predicted RNA-binding protein YlqC (UPF0109 family)
MAAMNAMYRQTELKRQTATVDCPKSMVGRVIGKNGETIKALQSYTGALIQIDQTVEPTKVTISGTPQSLNLAVSMVSDIVKGTFKGFALLRQLTAPLSLRPAPVPAQVVQPRPVYAPGYGLIPPSQLFGGEEQATVLPMQYAPARRDTMPTAMGYMAGQPVILGMQAMPQHANAAMLAAGMPQYTMQQQAQLYQMQSEYPGGMPGMVGGVEGVVYREPGMVQQAMMPSSSRHEHMAAASSHGRMLQGVKNTHQRGGVDWALSGTSSPSGSRSNIVAPATAASITPGEASPVEDLASSTPMGAGNWVQVVEQDGQTFYVNQVNG